MLNIEEIEAQLDLIIDKYMVVNMEVPNEVYQLLFDAQFIDTRQRYKGKVEILQNPAYSQLDQLLITYLHGANHNMKLIPLLSS